jgi:sialic acid synthase SpsE
MAVEIIAELSSNHGGSVELAKEFIWRCAESGADWVKFQTTRIKHLRPDDPQYEWFRRAELSDEAHLELRDECTKAGVKFLTTVYHAADVPFVASLGLEAVKIGSGEAGESSLAGAVMASSIPRIIVACGITHACDTPYFKIRRSWWPRQHVDFLRCVCRYPAPDESVSAAVRRRFVAGGTYSDRATGWSDHAVGVGACRIALLHGARIIEKHVQLPHQARPPKPYEATMEELKALRQFADEDPARFVGRWQHA